MFRYKINLVGYKDVTDFVNTVSTVEEAVLIKSGKYCGNAKSLLNVLASLEWGDVICESERDIQRLIDKYIVGESN